MNLLRGQIDLKELNELEAVLLVGAGGLTGRWYSRLLLADGKRLYAYDANEAVQYPEDLISHERFHRVSPQEFQSGSILQKVGGLTLSPGVAFSQEIFQKAAAMENPPLLFSELEYSFERLSGREWVCITGTDGKSTVTSLIAHLFHENGYGAVACGNFGVPFSQILVENERFADRKYLIAELSSYQLELARNLQPAAALYLNLAPDHLDRYDGFEEYGRTKWNIFSHMKKGLCLLNQKLVDSSLWPSHPLEQIASGCQKIFIDEESLRSKNFFWQGETLYLNKAPGEAPSDKEALVTLDQLSIGGRHNCTNTLFALETCFYFMQGMAGLKKALCTYRGLPHRFEKIDTADGNLYINDSKATTTQATQAALLSISKPLFLFLGGRSKGEDYSRLAGPLLEKEAQLFIFGENRHEIQEALERHGVKCSLFSGLEAAFQGAIERAGALPESKGITFLLSPASTSWDQYASFEKRGEHFRELVEKYVKKTSREI